MYIIRINNDINVNLKNNYSVISQRFFTKKERNFVYYLMNTVLK